MSLFATGIRPAIDAHLQTKREEMRDYGDYWSASAAGYCMRKNILERLKVPHTTDDDPRLQRVFEVGHIFHEWAQRITREAGLSIAQEVELQDEDLMIRGHFDDLVLVNNMKPGEIIPFDGKPGGEGERKAIAERQHLVLYDYKTAHSRSFHYSKGRPMSYYHKMQLATYMYMLRNKKFEEKSGWAMTGLTNDEHKLMWNLSEARVLKISKDDLVMEEKQLLWSDELEKEVLDYWQTLNKYWQEKKMPPCTCNDHEGGFMAKENYNPFYYNEEPCSLGWYELCKLEGKLK